MLSRAPIAAPNLPEHVAIIMDGNGRWAKQRGLPRIEGHRRGAETLKKITRAAHAMGVRHLTLFAFSSENWKRGKDEVDNLLKLMRFYLRRELKELIEENVRFRVIGDYRKFPQDIADMIDATIQKTAENTGITLCLALNYGGRQDILQAVKNFAQDCVDGKMSPQDIEERVFHSYLYSCGMPDPDLLIRTSGELRVSNFLLWQLSYSEFYFTDKHWPEFSEQDLQDAVASYQTRQRRFGSVLDENAYASRQTHASNPLPLLINE